ncbi:hypothetical protein D3C76_1873850 [compost metagenome]
MPSRQQFHQLSSGQLLAHGHPWQVSDTYPGHYEMTQGKQVVGDDSRCVRDHQAAAHVLTLK